jgi:hypothetical protein
MQKYPHSPYLGGKARIMAAMPQLRRPRIKQTTKKDSRHIKEIASASKIS